ncbi:MAG: hypothetical protein ACU836_06245 [Gammaproteobacteria bacterium]
MKYNFFVIMFILFIPMTVNGAEIYYQIYRTTPNEQEAPSEEECRQAPFYGLTGVDPTFRDGVSFLHTELRKTNLVTQYKRKPITVGYGCIWVVSEEKAYMYYSMETEFGDLKANGECQLIGYEQINGQTLLKTSCLLDIEENETAASFGIQSGALLSTTVFNMFGGQPPKGVLGSTWILQTWGGKPRFNRLRHWF